MLAGTDLSGLVLAAFKTGALDILHGGHSHSHSMAFTPLSGFAGPLSLFTIPQICEALMCRVGWNVLLHCRGLSTLHP
ncbi:hypothetical protein DSM14862_04104 (plasmid) [Sulfitobacter indolifex]|nr:hypothetical protein DSM14862_04104 [Sulfitobacter indolifex]